MADGPQRASEADLSEIGARLPEVDIPTGGGGPEVEGDVGEVERYTDEQPVATGQLRDPPAIFFKHSPDLTDAEMEIIIEGLRGHIPLYAIARKIKCGRCWLQRKIKEDPYLAETFEDAREAYIDNLEFQAKRLIDQGNPAMIMFGLERLGKHRGWGQTDTDENKEDDSRLVIGAIPDDMLADADAEIAEKSRGVPIVDTDGKIVSTVGIGDPMQQEMQQAMEESGIPPAVPPTVMPAPAAPASPPPPQVEVESVSPAPYDAQFAPQDGGGYVSGPWDSYVMDDW